MSDESDVSLLAAGDEASIAAPMAGDAIADVQAAMDEARRRVAEAPAEVVVTNHVMGLYELAAIHLSAEQPDLRVGGAGDRRRGLPRRGPRRPPRPGVAARCATPSPTSASPSSRSRTASTSATSN